MTKSEVIRGEEERMVEKASRIRVKIKLGDYMWRRRGGVDGDIDSGLASG